MLDVILAHIPQFIGLVFTGLAVLTAIGVKKVGLRLELEKAITDLTKRCFDKAHAWADIAFSPTGDGGVKVTQAEISALRQLVWDTAKEELKGPLAKMLLVYGEERVKGLAGIILAKLGVKVDFAPVTPEQPKA